MVKYTLLPLNIGTQVGEQEIWSSGVGKTVFPDRSTFCQKGVWSLPRSPSTKVLSSLCNVSNVQKKDNNNNNIIYYFIIINMLSDIT